MSKKLSACERAARRLKDLAAWHKGCAAGYREGSGSFYSELARGDAYERAAAICLEESKNDDLTPKINAMREEIERLKQDKFELGNSLRLEIERLRGEYFLKADINKSLTAEIERLIQTANKYIDEANKYQKTLVEIRDKGSKSHTYWYNSLILPWDNETDNHNFIHGYMSAIHTIAALAASILNPYAPVEIYVPKVEKNP